MGVNAVGSRAALIVQRTSGARGAALNSIAQGYVVVPLLAQPLQRTVRLLSCSLYDARRSL